MKESAAWAACLSGLTVFYRWRNRNRLAILMYHGVEQHPLRPDCWHVLDVEVFRRQLDYVRRHFRILPLEEALARLESGTLPQRAAALTFDDGTRNLATCAAPVLREFDLPAAVFLTTGPMGTDEALWPDRLWLAFARTECIDIDLTSIDLGMRSLSTVADRGATYAAVLERCKELPDQERLAQVESLVTALGPDTVDDPGPFRMLSWQEAREMGGDGLVTLYPHTVTHPILSCCSDDKIEREVADSCAAVQRETGTAPGVFAYPNGRSRDFDERARAALRRCGLRWALVTENGYADASSDPLALPRIPIGSGSSFARFRILVSGATEARERSGSGRSMRNPMPKTLS
ncbi:polysaccharide deacetylase [Mycolicibacterium psychrotolerans]|uniref:Polysaccharide deacetylase n=1 Tax=Mycolicibacterium psychrotolerans TaxID=216929 RepID=A0A7I7MFN2_9MYCO|nr:polysaccharide deacetylase [Mycolicibacterium psychrotolerans]